jgi:hypothetical protein
VHRVEREPAGYSAGENPVPAVYAGFRLAGIKDAVNIYQDQRGRPLHASMVMPLAGGTPLPVQASSAALTGQRARAAYYARP